MGRNEDIHLYRKAGYSYQSIANIYGISKQRVHQIFCRVETMRLNPPVKEKEPENNILPYMPKIKKELIDNIVKNGQHGKPTGRDADFLKMCLDKKYKIFRNGWPDYFVFTGKEWIGYEIKHGTDKLRLEQMVMQKIFKKIGIEYKVFHDKTQPQNK